MTKKALHIEGLWNVYNKTTTVTVIDHTEMTTTITIHPIVDGAPGNVSVTLASHPPRIPHQT